MVTLAENITYDDIDLLEEPTSTEICSVMCCYSTLRMIRIIVFLPLPQDVAKTSLDPTNHEIAPILPQIINIKDFETNEV